jgi:hypothetical protein
MSSLNEDFRLCFIISHKYYRNYKSIIELYIQNINKYYKNSYILIVDNKSKWLEDIINITKPYENVKIIINESNCFFEIGAYKYGINFLKNNNLLKNFDYFVFTQDNFIVNKKYDFNNLKKNDVNACTLYSFYQFFGDKQEMIEYCKNVLTNIGLYNRLDEITFCWCSSFILHNSKVEIFYDYVKDIVITKRTESEASERYLARILYELNSHINFDIDGDIRNSIFCKHDYNKFEILENINNTHHFVKIFQNKNENTEDI